MHHFLFDESVAAIKSNKTESFPILCHPCVTKASSFLLSSTGKKLAKFPIFGVLTLSSGLPFFSAIDLVHNSYKQMHQLNPWGDKLQ